jgi:hypothetical protein
MFLIQETHKIKKEKTYTKIQFPNIKKNTFEKWYSLCFLMKAMSKIS